MIAVVYVVYCLIADVVVSISILYPRRRKIGLSLIQLWWGIGFGRIPATGQYIRRSGPPNPRSAG